MAKQLNLADFDALSSILRSSSSEISNMANNLGASSEARLEDGQTIVFEHLRYRTQIASTPLWVLCSYERKLSVTKPIETLARAREKLCRLVLERDLEQEALFGTRSKEEARRVMKQLAKDGLAEKCDGKWQLTWLGKKAMQEAEARLRARR